MSPMGTSGSDRVMKFYRIDNLLIEQISTVLKEFERWNPEWRLVSRALRNELLNLPPDLSIEDFNRLIREWEGMFGIGIDDLDQDDMLSDPGDQSSEDQSSVNLSRLLDQAGIRLRDRSD